MQIQASVLEKSMKFSQKSKSRTTIWPTISTSGYLPKENENTYCKRYMHTHIHCSTIYNSQDTETIKVSHNKERNFGIYIIYIQYTYIYIYIHLVYIYTYIYLYTHTCVHIYIYTHTHTHIYTHTHHGVLFSHEKEWNLAICDNIVGSQKHYEK